MSWKKKCLVLMMCGLGVLQLGCLIGFAALFWIGDPLLGKAAIYLLALMSSIGLTTVVFGAWRYYYG